VVKLSRVEVGGLFGDLVFLDRYATWIATRTDTVVCAYPSGAAAAGQLSATTNPTTLHFCVVNCSSQTRTTYSLSLNCCSYDAKRSW
jgi:hypothetical protein